MVDEIETFSRCFNNFFKAENKKFSEEFQLVIEF